MIGPSLNAAPSDPFASSREAETELERTIVGLYRNHFEGLFRFAMTITQDRVLAEDAIQDTFLRFFVARREDRAIRSPVPWLYRVLRNRLLDDIRRISREPFSDESGAVREADWTSCPEAAVRHEQASSSLRAALSGRELECLQLRLEGLNYKEIASALRIRPGTVGALLTRALKKSRKILEQEGSDR